MNKTYTIKSVLSVNAQMVFKDHKKYKVSSLTTVMNSKVVLKAAYNFCFALIGRFSPVYIHGRLLKQIEEPQAAFGTTFKVTSGKAGRQKAGTSSLHRVTRRILTTNK